MAIGSNKIKKSSLMFYARKSYDVTVNDDNYIDFWREKPLYGKTDYNFNAIYPSEIYLKSISENVFALNIVADAFNAMKNYLTEADIRGKLTESFFYPLEPKKGWANMNELYFNHIEKIYSAYYKKFASEERINRQLKNFDDYMVKFDEFLDIMVSKHPISKTGFIMKSYCPHMISGLAVEIDDKHKYSEDFEKLTDFFKNPDFEIYNETAKKFGFYVDKNAPWRLVANLTSPAWTVNPALKEILNSYKCDHNLNIKLDNLFDLYYYKAYEQDIEILKIYAKQFYNGLVSKKPYIYMPMLCKRGTTRTKKLRRFQIKNVDLELKYGDLYWLKKYLDIRFKEMNADLPLSMLEQLENKYLTLGYTEALKFINEKTIEQLKELLQDFTNQREGTQTKSTPTISVDAGGLTTTTY